MKTIRCPECNLVDWENAILCKRCNYQFQPVGQTTTENELNQNNFENQTQETQIENNQSIAQGNNQSTDFQEQRAQFDETFNHFPTDGQGQDYQRQNSQQNQHHQYSRNQGNQQPPFNQQYQQSAYAKPKLRIKTAVSSMVFGILSFPAIWAIWVGLLTGILFALLGLTGLFVGGSIGFGVILLSIILGIVALFKAKKYPKEYGGKGFAITGVVCSSFGLITIPIIAAIAIPNLLAARRAANEGGAISNLRQLSKVQTTFMANNHSGRCGTLQELGNLKLIDSVLAKGEKMGYRYLVIKIPTAQGGCELLATPISKSTGTRSFFYSTEDYVMRAEDKNGEFADKNSPPLDDGRTIIPQRPQISENH